MKSTKWTFILSWNVCILGIIYNMAEIQHILSRVTIFIQIGPPCHLTGFDRWRYSLVKSGGDVRWWRQVVTSLLGFKARVGSALFTLSRGIHYTFPEVHLWCYMLLPHMHQQRWDLARIWTNDHPYRRRTRYHCASDPALPKTNFVTSGELLFSTFNIIQIQNRSIDYV